MLSSSLYMLLLIAVALPSFINAFIGLNKNVPVELDKKD